MFDFFSVNKLYLRKSLYLAFFCFALSLVFFYLTDKVHKRFAYYSYTGNQSLVGFDNYFTLDYPNLYSGFISSQNNSNDEYYPDIDFAEFEKSFSIFLSDSTLSIAIHSDSDFKADLLLNFLKSFINNSFDEKRSQFSIVYSQSLDDLKFVESKPESREAFLFYTSKLFDISVIKNVKLTFLSELSIIRYDHAKNISLSFLVLFLSLFASLFYIIELKTFKK